MFPLCEHLVARRLHTPGHTQYRSVNPQYISNRQQQHACRTPAGITQAWLDIVQTEWASQDFYSLLPEHACNRASDARVAVTLQGQAVPGSPFQPQFRSSGAVDPGKSLAHYTGTPFFFGFYAGDAVLSAVTVSELRDEYGNAYREPPSEAELFYMPPLQLLRDFDDQVCTSDSPSWQAPLPAFRTGSSSRNHPTPMPKTPPCCCNAPVDTCLTTAARIFESLPSTRSPLTMLLDLQLYRIRGCRAVRGSKSR